VGGQQGETVRRPLEQGLEGLCLTHGVRQRKIVSVVAGARISHTGNARS
jgi:hypothetical protein